MIKWFWYLWVIPLLFACSDKKPTPNFINLSGQTMGTYYKVECRCDNYEGLKESIDSMLIEINMAASTYIPTSIISTYNQNDLGLQLKIDQDRLDRSFMFYTLWEHSLDIANRTDGYYDPTVMQLVNYWGFGPEKKEVKSLQDTLDVMLLKEKVGYEKVILNRDDGTYLFSKLIPGVELDFSSIAKGYGVDLLQLILLKYGCDDALIDIGGEMRTIGKNKRGVDWVTGINLPDPEAAHTDIFLKIRSSNNAIATSGNYRNYYSSDGVEYGHTINPISGFPERNDVLSATVIAENCMLADGWATAFMVLGLERSKTLADQLDGLEALFIYNENGAFKSESTPGFRSYIIEEK